MSRRFLDDIRSDLNTLLVTGGETTADELRPLLIDMIDSTIQDECAIASNFESTGVPTTASWTSLTTGIYDEVLGGDGDFLIPDAVNGTCTSSATAGFTYGIEGKVSFDDISANTAIEFSILADGVQVGFIAELTGGGNARSRTASFSRYDVSADPSTVYTIGVRTPNGAQDIDVRSIGMSLTIQPTNNP